jgi:hypothetical protein
MQNDPIVEEVGQIRQAYAQRFRFDLLAMVEDLRKKEQQHPERLLVYPAKSTRRLKTA